VSALDIEELAYLSFATAGSEFELHFLLSSAFFYKCDNVSSPFAAIETTFCAGFRSSSAPTIEAARVLVAVPSAVLKAAKVDSKSSSSFAKLKLSLSASIFSLGLDATSLRRGRVSVCGRGIHLFGGVVGCCKLCLALCLNVVHGFSLL
jgi:hypothetical protein